MKTKTTLQRTALTLGLSFTAATSLYAQLNGALGLDMGGNSSTGRITAAETITDISTYGVGVFPQGWRTPFLDIANMVAPVSQFTGVNNDGSNVNVLDLIPFRSTSYQIVNPVTGVISPLASSASNGLMLTGSDTQLGGTLTKLTSIAQAGNALNIQGGDVNFAPVGVTYGLSFTSGTDTANNRIASNGGIEIMTGSQYNQLFIAANGNVGVGTGTPTQAKFAVVGSIVGNVGYSSGYYSQVASGNITPYGTYNLPSPGGLDISIYASGDIVSSGAVRSPFIQGISITVSSDERIKNIVGVSDSSRDLKTLEQIEITDYSLKDRSLQRSSMTKKVIAQQIESVYPNAVNQTSDKLPDVMQLATVVSLGDGKVELALPKETSLKVGERISVLDQNNSPTVTTIEKIEGKKIFVALADVKAGDRRFVYGRQVDDFRTVDYDAISMLNVSATQELAKKVSALEAKNIELNAKNAKLTASMSKLEALEKAVAALEGKSNGSVTVSLTK